MLRQDDRFTSVALDSPRLTWALMFIDASGREHPEHLKEFKRHFAGLCLVNEDVEVLIDNRDRELKMFELYVRAFNCTYTIERAGELIRIKIKGPFNICGF